MPRTKVAPSRKRSLAESNNDSDTLDACNVSAEDVLQKIEAAEIASVRRRIADGRCRELSFADDDEATPAGLARLTLDRSTLEPLRALHATIKEKVAADGLASWGGITDKSTRKRAYGYLASSGPAAQEHFEVGHAMKEYTGAAADADRASNRRASVRLEAADLPADLDGALERLTAALAPLLPERYRTIVQPHQLIAAQPNLHCGCAYLRPHLDEPLADGFGVVIVTIAVTGAAKILLNVRPWEQAIGSECFFHLREGQLYALSGDARNAALHGVLADDGSEARESLNLRFGLHSARPEDDFSAWKEVESLWPEARAGGGWSRSHGQ